MVLYRPLADIDLGDLSTYGGKAARLGNALQLGCPVLPGIVLSTELYRRFMHQSRLKGEIASILSSMQPTVMAHFQAVEWAIRAAFQVRRMTDDVADILLAAWQEIGEQSIAVRSSATREDSPGQSFVGQHATYLDIDSQANLIKAVLGCWMSLFSAKALSYAQHFGVDLINSSMAIVLQPMIKRSQHGALFTVDPINGNPDRFIIEIQQGPRRGVHRLDPYERAPGELYHWSQLRHYALLLDEHETAFQAIEWIVAEEQLYLMRVRPVTSVPPYLPTADTQAAQSDAPLYLVRPPGNVHRLLRPFSWYHRSRSPMINAARFRLASKPFTRYASREEHYVKGYQYAREMPFSGERKEGQVGKLVQMALDIQALQSARTTDHKARSLLAETRPELDGLAKTKPSALRKHQLASYMRQVIEIETALWSQSTHIKHVAETLAGMFTRLHGRLFGDDPKRCQELLATADDRLSRSRAELRKRAQSEYADDQAAQEELESALETFQHLYLADDPQAEWQDICRLYVDREQFLSDWHRFQDDEQDKE